MDDGAIEGLAAGWSERIGRARRWMPPRVPTLVAAPHPDDESLSTGGLIAHLRRHDVPVVVIAVTDGGAAYPDLMSSGELSHLRRNEQRQALELLGVDHDAVWRVGIDDGTVADEELTVRGMIEHAAASYGIGHIVAPWTGDHHTDHEAVGRAADAVAAMLGMTITFSLFWGLYRTDAPPVADFDVLRLELTTGELHAKRAAIAAHATQVTTALSPMPVLERAVLSVADRPFELFLTRPCHADR